MTDPNDSLIEQTAAWRRRAAQAADCPPADWREALALARGGILLRRQWDRTDRDASDRRELLRLLPAAQTIAQDRLAKTAAEEGHGKREAIDEVVRQATEDGRYLSELLGDPAGRASSAFALACFRDDLHWLSTQTEILDGHPGADALGRIRIEQEAIQRQLDDWPGEDRLHAASRQLQSRVLARRAESLLQRPDPSDCPGWYAVWQAASRLAARLRAEPGEADGLRRPIEEYRDRARRCWAECLATLPPEARSGALARTVETLADTAAESLTFLEDQSLSAAVATLEILQEDAQTSLDAVETCGGHESSRLRRTLRRRKATIDGQLQDRRLARRMENLFGHRAVAALEKFILFLLVFFVVMLAAEGPLLDYEAAHWLTSPEQPSRVEAILAWLDLAVCLVFLSEFGLKWALAQGKWLYFKRNWLTGLLPAIPVGFLAYATHRMTLVVEEGEWIVLLRALRYLRLPQMARWLRIARPVLRAVRLVGFILWASDRLVRQLSPLLNRSVVLFERAAIEELDTPHRAALAALRQRFHGRASEATETLPPDERSALVQSRIDDLAAMLESPGIGAAAAASSPAGSPTREIRLEEAIASLQSATPAGVAERAGRGSARSIARWCRALDLFGVRRLPVVRDLVAAGRLADPYEATAQAANRVGGLLEQLLERAHWFADLYGTVTAPQLVDSIGDWMVRRTAVPTRRFLTFGGLFLILWYLSHLLPYETLGHVTGFFQRILGTPLIVLGTLCLVPLLIGLWFRQIAGEASDFYSKVAEAQFISATKGLKHRLASRHHAFLDHRVLAPEREVLGEEAERTESVRRTVELLWNDYLEGAPFHRSDVRVTIQLLGNLDLLSLYGVRLAYGRRQQKRLRRLDLTSSRGSLRGPYLWFHFVSRSLAQQTARLVVDYNTFALPLARIGTASGGEVRRYVQWLARRSRRRVEDLDLPSPLRERYQSLPPEPADGADGANGRTHPDYQGSDFTALDFLTADPEREDDVRRRYGGQVADLVRRDRRDNIRRVFRTYPLHHWPKERRTFNPASFYQQHLAGGWVLLFPLKVLGWGLRLAGRGLRLVLAGVRDVLHPTAANLAALGEPDPYAVAVRKIHRMRKPLFLECLRMRAEFDPEYLGVVLPGGRAPCGAAPTEEDLALIAAEPPLRRHYVRLAAQRRRQVSELRPWLGRLGLEAGSRESLRAVAIAYTIDYGGVRSRLEAVRVLERAMEEALAGGAAPRGFRRPILRGRRFHRMVDRLFQQPGFAKYDDAQRAILRRFLWHRRRMLGQALRRVAGNGAPADPVADAQQVLQAVGRDPATWSRQLVVLRTVQTLSVLDLNTYCDLVAELGEYDANRGNGLL